jgi:aspartate dehydrogenase
LKQGFTVLLIGYGAIGRAVARHFANDPEVRISGIVVRSRKECSSDSQPAAQFVSSVEELPEVPDFALECAGHSAIVEHVIPLLGRGVDVAIASTGALSEDGLVGRIETAATSGGAQFMMISGAGGGIDALAAARIGGLQRVVYTAKKPPLGWKGTVAEGAVDLDCLKEAAVIFRGRAREATRLYPKNANVAATVSLAGLGLDGTEVTLVADPNVSRNIHRIEASGAFGEMTVTISGNPVSDNPRTSRLTIYSAIRAIYRQSQRFCI